MKRHKSMTDALAGGHVLNLLPDATLAQIIQPPTKFPKHPLRNNYLSSLLSTDQLCQDER